MKRLDIEQVIDNSLTATAPDYVELQREQMFSGIQSDGDEIQRIGVSYKGYAPKTIKIKEAKGQPTDRITLRDTQAFQDDIFSEPRQEGLIVGSGDEKSAMLQRDYGNKIFGLASKSKAAYIEKLRPVAVQQAVAQLNRR